MKKFLILSFFVFTGTALFAQADKETYMNQTVLETALPKGSHGGDLVTRGNYFVEVVTKPGYVSMIPVDATGQTRTGKLTKNAKVTIVFTDRTQTSIDVELKDGAYSTSFSDGIPAFMYVLEVEQDAETHIMKYKSPGAMMSK